MPDAAPADEWLGHSLHANGSLQPRGDADGLECILKRQAIDDGRQHSHVMGRGRRDRTADCRKLAAAKDVAPAHDDRQLHPGGHHALDLFGSGADGSHADAGLARSAEAFARQLQQHPPICGDKRRAGRGIEAGRHEGPPEFERSHPSQCTAMHQFPDFGIGISDFFPDFSRDSDFEIRHSRHAVPSRQRMKPVAVRPAAESAWATVFESSLAKGCATSTPC